MVDTATKPRVQTRPMTDEERQACMRMFREGKGVREIARHFNRAPSTVSRTLRSSGMSAGGSTGGARIGARPTGMAAGRSIKAGAARAGGTKARAIRPKAGGAKVRAARPKAGGAKASGKTAARSKPMTAARSMGARAVAGNRSGTASTISRGDLRNLDQRIARIEGWLSRVGTLVRPASGGGAKAGGTKAGGMKAGGSKAGGTRAKISGTGGARMSATKR